MNLIDWGDFPTWLASAFGAGAFAGALLLFRVEAGRDKRQRDLDEQSQAEMVTAWVKAKPGFRALELGIQNASKACVFELYVSYEVRRKVLGYELYDVVVPKNDPVRQDVPERIIRADFEDYDSRGYQGNIRPAIYFRDSANRRWKRDYEGRLKRIEDDDDGYLAARSWFMNEMVDVGNLEPRQSIDEFLEEYGKPLRPETE